MGLAASGSKRWKRIAIWCAVILAAQSGASSDFAHNLLGWITGISSDNGPRLHFLAQKVFHIILFGGFGALVPLPSTRAGWTKVVLGCLILAVGSEMLQMLSPGRTARKFDVCLNIVACFVPLLWRARNRGIASDAFDS